jgi:hypothetical protein
MVAVIAAVAASVGMGSVGVANAAAPLLPQSAKQLPHTPAANAIKPNSLSGYQIVSTPLTNLNGGFETSVTAACPLGMEPFSGGESNNSSGGINLIDSYPSGKGWTIKVINNSQSTAGFAGFAVCGSGLTTYQVITGGAATVPPRSRQNTDFAACPTADVAALSGGQHVQNLDNSSVIVDFELHSSWWGLAGFNPLVEAWNIDSSNGGSDPVTQTLSVTPYVVCGGGMTISHAATPATSISGYGASTATCPAGTNVVGGGLWTPNPSDAAGQITDSFPSSSNQWTIWYLPDPGQTASVGAAAICGS